MDGSTYNYRVIIDVEVNTPQAGQGANATETYLKRVEQQVKDSQKRITDYEAQAARSRYDAKIADYNRQIEATRRNAQAEIDIETRKNQQIASERSRNHQKRMRDMQAQYQAEREAAEKAFSYSAEQIRRENELLRQRSNLFGVGAAQNQQARSYSSPGGGTRGGSASAGQGLGSTRTDRISAALRTGDLNGLLDGSERLEYARRNIKQVNDLLKENAALTGKSAESYDRWGAAFKGAFIGAIGGIAISAIFGSIVGLIAQIGNLVAASVRMGAEFEQTRNSVAVFAGSARAAERELHALDETARNMPGLELESAEKGYRQLRALGFQAEESRKLVAGLARQSLLSGADEQAVQRVIVNLTQLSAGSSRASQDIREIIHAMPSLRKEFKEAFGTIDSKAIAQLFSDDPSNAIKKLTDQLERTKQVQGGLNSAYTDFNNELTLTGREIAREVVPELTRGLKGFTDILRENKNAAAEFGKALADGTRDAVDDILALYRDVKAIADILDRIKAGDTPDEQNRNIDMVNPLRYRSRSTLNNPENNARRLARALQEAGQQQVDAINEMETQRLEFESKQLDFIEKARQQGLEFQSQYFQKESALSANYYRLEEAKLKSHLDLTLEAQLDTIKKVSANKEKQINAELEIQSKLFAAEIALTNGDKAEMQKIEIKYNKIFSDLETERAINTINTQKEVAQKEREILLQRREAQREAIRLQSDELKFEYDNQIFQIERAMKLGIGTTERGYQELTDASNKYFQDLRALTIQQYDLRLQDETLSKEQIVNLNNEKALELRKIDEESYRNTVEIEDRKNEAIIKNLTFQRNAAKQTYEFLAGMASSLQRDFFDTEIFSSASLRDFNSFVLKSDKRRLLTEGLSATQQRLDDFQIRAQSAKQGTDLYEKYKSGSQALLKSVEDQKAAIENLNNSIPKNYFLFAQLAEQIGITSGAVDKLNKALLGHRQRLDMADAQAEVDYLELILKRTKDVDQQNELSLKIQQAKNRVERLEYDQNIEKANQYRESLAGINEEIGLLLSGDRGRLGALKDIFDKQQGEEVKSTLTRIRMLEFELASPDINAQYRQRAEILEHMVELRNEETDAITRSAIALIDLNQQFQYSAVRADADLMEFLASQKGITEILSDARINAITTAYDGLDMVAKSLAKNFGIASKAVEDLISSLLKLGLNYIFRRFLMGSGSQGGMFGGIPGFGGGGMGIGGLGGTAVFNPNAGSGVNLGGLGGGGVFSYPGFGLMRPPGAQTGDIITLPDGTLATQVNAGSGGTGGLTGIGQQFRSMLPFLGATLGIGLGRGSIGGSILGGAGGGLLGLVGGAFGSSSTAFGGMFGSIGSFLGISGAATLGIGAAVGGGLLAAAYLIGRSAARRRDEKTRNAAILDAFRQIDDLIKGVNNDTIDGGQALAQAQQIRQTYVEQMSQLKTKKTREIALKDVSRIDAKISELNMAITNQQSRRDRLEASVPTFADGGSLSSWMKGNYAHNPLGYQQGGQRYGYFPEANRIASFNERGSEYILDAETTRNVGVQNLDLMRKTKGQSFKDIHNAVRVGSFASGGSAASPSIVVQNGNSQSGGSGLPQIVVHNNITLGIETIIEIFAEMIDAHSGSKQNVTDITQFLDNDGGAELVQRIMKIAKSRGMI